MLARALLVSFIVLSVPASAQQAQQPPAVNYQITLEAKQIGEIAEALGALPYNRAAPIMQAIGRQIEEQNKAREWEKANPASPVPAPQVPK